MRLNICFHFALVIFVLGMASCTKPVLIGSDLLEDEKASLQFKDDFELSFFTERSDSIVVHSDNVSLQLITYLCGHLDDPIFGQSTAEIFTQPILPTVGTELINKTLDSVVLQLRYDTVGSYGNLNEPVTIEVYRMAENPEFKTKYYSHQRFMTYPDLLGSLTFIPRPFDSVTVVNVSTSDTFKIGASIRIPLDPIKFSDFVMQDSAIYSDQEMFLDFFNGLHIKMTGATNTMLGFDLLNSRSALQLFYINDNNANVQFDLIFTSGSIKTVYMEHDLSGSVAEPSLNPEAESEYWFVQGMAGLTTKMTIGGLESIGNAIINQAELEVYCTFPAGDNPVYYPPIPYLVTQYPTDTTLANSLDVNIALSRVNGNVNSPVYDILYGGVLEEVLPGPQGVYRYTMKVTSQVKDIFQGKKENVIYFNPYEKPNFPNRSVMAGPSHPEFAPRLRIYYTSL